MSAGFDVQLLTGEPILLTTLYEDLDPKLDPPRIAAEMTRIFDAATEPIYMLDDLRQLKVNFSDLVSMLAVGSRGTTGVVRHANVRKIVLVTNNELLKFGGQALRQSQYGAVAGVDVYASLDEALDAIRAEIASKQSVGEPAH